MIFKTNFKYKFRLLIISFLILVNGKVFSARWIELNAIGFSQPQSDLPHIRTGGILWSLNDTIYYGGGYNDGINSAFPLSDFHQLNISNNLWSDEVSLPFDMNLTNFQTFTINGKGYYCDESNHTWEFDPMVNSWTQKSDYPGSARSGSICFSANNKGYLTTGKDSLYNYINTCYEFDPSLNLWTQKANFPASGRENGAVLSFPTGGLIIGGYSNVSSQVFNDCWFYEEASDSWIQKASLNDSISDKTFSFTLNGLGYCVIDSSVWQFDLSNNLWSAKNNFVLPVYSFYFSGTSANGNGYAINGEYIYKYNPILDTWSEVTSPKYLGGSSLRIGNATYLNGFKLDLISMTWTQDTTLNAHWFFAIGNNAFGIHNASFQSYNTVSGVWNQLAPPPFVNLLPETFALNGKGYAKYYSGDFYEYDPTINIWSMKSSFPGMTLYGGIIFTNNSTAYYGLGFTGDFWSYDQISDTWSQKASGPANGFMFYNTIDSIGYAGGGSFVDGGVLAESIFCKYDMNSDKWDYSENEGSNFPSDRIGGFSFNYNGNLFVGGGSPGYSINSPPPYIDLWQYQPNSLSTIYSLPQNICTGEQYNGTYSTSSTLDSSNYFQLILSDSVGDFTNATVLSTFYSTINSGSFNFTIPQGNYFGNSYRLKLISSSPLDCIISVDSFLIGSVLVQSFVGQTAGISQFQTLNYSVLSESGISYFWNVTNGNVVSGQGTNAVSIQWGNNTSGVIQVVATNGSCTDTLVINVTIGTTDLGEMKENLVLLRRNVVTSELEIINTNNISFSYTISDLNGHELISSRYSSDKISVENLKNGLYNIRFDIHNQSVSKRFVKVE